MKQKLTHHLFVEEEFSCRRLPEEPCRLRRHCRLLMRKNRRRFCAFPWPIVCGKFATCVQVNRSSRLNTTTPVSAKWPPDVALRAILGVTAVSRCSGVCVTVTETVCNNKITHTCAPSGRPRPGVCRCRVRRHAAGQCRLCVAQRGTGVD